MNIHDLGELQGDVLLFGGPYSNLQAFEALVELAERAGIPRENRICNGDLVAYGADGSACVELARAEIGAIVAGNCEKQLASGAVDCGCGFDEGSACSILSVGWFRHARATISQVDCDWMGKLPDRVVFQHSEKRYAVIHGGATDISRFLWPASPKTDFDKEIDQLKQDVGDFDVVIAGHSGIPFARQFGNVEWVNVGVIGLPAHDGTRDTRYIRLDENGLRIERLHYDAVSASKAMTAAGLTQGYHEALLTGYWPSEDTLPPELRIDQSGMRASPLTTKSANAAGISRAT